MTDTTLWIAYAATGREFEAEEALRLLDVECIVPRQINLLRRGNNRRPEPVESPFLPNYVFAWVTPDQWYWLKDANLRTCMGVSAASERLVRAFIDRVQADYTARRAQIEAGERVAEYEPGDLLRITTGPFAEQLVRFRRMVERADQMFPRISAEIDALGGAVPLELDPLHVRRATA